MSALYSEMNNGERRDSEPLRDWLVTFARKVAEERDYSARHPGHVFLVMLREDEAEGLLAETADLLDAGGRLDDLRSLRYDPECYCCRAAAQILSGNASWPK